jgi:2Fe-2S ferredoxin
MKIFIALPNGQEQEVEGKPGISVMEALRAGGVSIRAECGGAMACATCHVHVAPAWAGAVGPADAEECDLLDDSDYQTRASRLSCQIDCTNSLDGLNVALQLDALED